MRIDWDELPEAVTTEIADRVGEGHVIPATAGDHAEIAATVTGCRGKVFVKAAHTDLGVRSLRFELRVSEAVSTSHSPAVEWYFEAAGWLVVGFEHCDGPHADLSPASPGLHLLGEALTVLGDQPAPDVPLFDPKARLGFEHPAMAGDTLVHTDLCPANLIVTPRGLRIVDWAMATRAAPWVELAAVMPWLIGSGHTPQQAEEWVAGHPAWAATDPDVMTFFATRNADKWSAKAHTTHLPWMRDLATWTGQWAAYRRQKDLATLCRNLGKAQATTRP
ncbi:phosphotransferase [Actinoplanes sp. DH11]|uniref:phosphotransferase n=1 Tax=Actinoplanes sp. DH11 TaxID=2857011 RepID=UPI001E320D03|nr:phosphotransferase [Actinoplanes sp. DH11]